ncbi:MAG TPA: hypothetical protein VF456_02640 [Vicinamibacterales bacterium]
MSKHAITIPDGVARFFRAGPLILIVAAVSALVGAAVAIPRYCATTACVVVQVVQVQAPQPVTPSPAELLLPAPVATPVEAQTDATSVEDRTDAAPVEDRTDAAPVEERTVSASLRRTPVKAERRPSKEQVSEEPVVRKWNGDWEAATAHLGSNRVDASGATAARVAPAATANTVADASSGATSNATAPDPVTISGCLEMSIDRAHFRLADTEGANAPKARSWRTGFLKKEATPVDLLELGDPATARKYVGQRVTATGVVENREMRVQSMRPSGNGCD